jgi:hypothetical protein
MVAATEPNGKTKAEKVEIKNKIGLGTQKINVGPIIVAGIFGTLISVGAAFALQYGNIEVREKIKSVRIS